MTRAEAIKILKAAETDHFPYEPEKLVEAFELSIASLEADEAYQLEYEASHATWEKCEDADGVYGICSKCGCDADFSHYGTPFEYCPNCGAKMVEPQESEDKE